MAEQVFVAREAELDRLQALLRKALAGETQVCFVAGDAGAGKSALIAHFARRAQAAEETLLVALGECNAQTGLGDPFLPFREILSQLTGDTDTTAPGGKITAQNAARLSNFFRISGRALVEVAPDIIGTLIPGSLILAKAAKIGAEKAGWLTQLEKKAAASPTKLDETMIFQQIANLLGALAKEQSLLLILDDLQWADSATIALLFYLSRTLKGSRILIVGAYRPSDVALGRDGARHPLENTLNEIERYRGEVRIDLNETAETDRRAFIEAFIDSEPNHLDVDFRAALFAHTSGYPLFTVELLRHLQEQGDLVWDEAALCWTQPGTIDWDDLPARVEGVIQERIGRLAENLRDILTTASVEGMQFTTQVVSRVRAVAERVLLETLSEELERRHRLVVEAGEEKIDRVRLWHYQFSHILFQKYLYDELSKGQRRLLHGDVAHVLEELYGERADTIAVHLARHYEEAGEDEKAAHYYRRAGEQAAAVYGNAEAIRHFSRALELTADSAAATRFDLVQAREAIYHLQGARDAQRADIDTLERLAEILEKDRKRADVALHRAAYCAAVHDYPAGITAAQRAISLAQTLSDPILEAESRYQLGSVYWSQRDVSACQTQLEQSLTLARVHNLRLLEARSLNILGQIMGNQETEVRQRYYEDALRIVRDLGDRTLEAALLNNLGWAKSLIGDAAGAESCWLEALRIEREIGYRKNEGGSLNALGMLAAQQGDYRKAQTYYEEARQLARETEDRYGESAVLCNVSFLHQSLGSYDLAHDRALTALTLAQALGNLDIEQYALEVLGHALIGLGLWDAAADSYRAALAIQRAQDDPFNVAETLAGLARVELARQNLPGAMAHIEEVLGIINGREIDAANGPVRIYLTCYQVLNAMNDPRADIALRTGYGIIQREASRITDESLRRSYLENVTSNRDLLAVWKSQSGSRI